MSKAPNTDILDQGHDIAATSYSLHEALDRMLKLSHHDPITFFVAGCGAAGVSGAAIAAYLGTSRQAVSKHFRALDRNHGGTFVDAVRLCQSEHGGNGYRAADRRRARKVGIK